MERIGEGHGEAGPVRNWCFIERVLGGLTAGQRRDLTRVLQKDCSGFWRRMDFTGTGTAAERPVRRVLQRVQRETTGEGGGEWMDVCSGSNTSCGWVGWGLGGRGERQVRLGKEGN